MSMSAFFADNSWLPAFNISTHYSEPTTVTFKMDYLDSELWSNLIPYQTRFDKAHLVGKSRFHHFNEGRVLGRGVAVSSSRRHYIGPRA